jgi:hypothetical protein
MDNKNVKVGFTLGSILLLCFLTMGLSVAMIYSSGKLDPVISQDGPVSAEVIEAKYGKVDQKALHEVKEGIFANIRARRQGCQPCRPCYPQQCYSAPPVSYYSSSSYSTQAAQGFSYQSSSVIYTTPISYPQSTPNPSGSCPGGICPAPVVHSPAPPEPLVFIPGNPIKIQPSTGA